MRLVHLLLSLSLLAAGCADRKAGSSADAGPGAAPDAGGGADLPITERYRPLADQIEAELAASGAPGVAVLVAEQGEVTFAHGFGKAHPDRERPVGSRTLFRVGSVTKVLTAAVLLQVIGPEGPALDSPLSDVLPSFDLESHPGAADDILLEDLLTHASGLVDYLQIDASEEDAALSSYLTGPFQSIAYLMSPPGRMWNYSNPNFYLAGLAIERLSESTYREAMHERLFSPLGMARTVFLGADAVSDGDYAFGATTDDAGRPAIVSPEDYDNAWARPAGYALSSVWDLHRFVDFLARGDGAVLPDAEREAMRAPQVQTELLGGLLHYGYGLFVQDGAFVGEDYHDVRVIHHGGDIPGYAATMYFVPESGFAFIALANGDGVHFRESLDLALELYADLPPPTEAPDIAPDPARFARYAGRYHDPFNVGDVTVEFEEGELRVTMPDVENAGISYEPTLEPTFERSFVLQIQGVPLAVTFILDDSGEAEYLRTRAFVAERLGEQEKVRSRGVHTDRLRRALRAIQREASPSPSAIR